MISTPHSWKIKSFFLKLVNLFVSADTESLHREIPLDPCTPRGYAPEKEALKVSPSLIEKKSYLSTFFPSGNFSECRSASLKLLQRGQGILSDFFHMLLWCTLFH